MKKELSNQQKVFVDEYLKDLNATKAAERSGYSDPGYGRQLITKPNVAQAVKAAMDKRSQRTGVTVDRVLQEYACLAFFDISKIVNELGEPLRLSEMDEDTKRAIVGVDIVTISGPEGSPPGQIMKIKMADKKGALDSCARHLGMFEKDNNQASGADALTQLIHQLCNGNEKLRLPSQDIKG